jgi:CHAT domain-containing protein
LERNQNEPAARAPWKEILELAAELGDRRWEARAKAEIGQILYMDGNIKAAAAMLRDAILAQYLDFDLGAAIYYTAMVGNGFVETGQAEAGLRYCDIILRASHLVPDLGFPFLAHQGKARALYALHRDAEANSILDNALKRARDERNHFALAQLLIVRGTGAASSAQPEAIKALKEANEISEQNGFQHVFAWSAFELVDVYRHMHDLDAAEHLGTKAIEVMRKLDDVYHLPQDLALVANIENKKGNFRRADELYREATDVMNALLVNVVRRQLKSSLIATLSDAYVEHFALVAEKFGDVGKAYEIIEEARGRVLADTLRGESESLAASSDEISIEANREITRIQLALMHESDPNTRESMLDQLFAAEQLLAPEPKVLSDLKSSTDKRRVVPLSSVQKSLREDEMLLEYVLGEPQSYCLRITRTYADVVVVLAGRKQIEKFVDDYHGAVRSGQSEIAAGRELFSLVLQPVVDHESTGRLIIVPDGKLNLLPFDGLKDLQDKYVLESDVVTYAPSASALHLLRESRHRQSLKPAFLGVGDVIHPKPTSIDKAHITDVTANSAIDFFDVSAVRFPDLPGSGQEVTSVAEIIHARTQLLLGTHATEAVFKSLPLADFGIVHFAVHGLANSQFPDRAALVLGSSRGSTEDGLLQVREIRDLPVSADLVTLSACDSGNGRLLGEEGIASLERAFLLAGARSVLASLWTADDTYTVALMKRFYEHLMNGIDNGAALRQAKLDLLHKFSNQALPLYWAGFTLVGDGQITLTR